MATTNEKKIHTEEIEIRSQALMQLLSDTSIYWKDDLEDVDRTFTIDAPFYNFVWSWEACCQAGIPRDSDSESTKEARKDLSDLLGLVQTSNTRESYFKARDNILKTKKIKFEYLWTIFGHGQQVYANSFLEEMQMLEVHDFWEQGEALEVLCRGVDWDGAKLATYHYYFSIKEYQGERPINSLDVVPVDLFNVANTAPDNSDLRTKLIERGRRFCELCSQDSGALQCEYVGDALTDATSLHRLNPVRMKEARHKEASSGADSRFYDMVPYNIPRKDRGVIIDNWTFLNSARNPRWFPSPPLGVRPGGVFLTCQCLVCKLSPIQKVANASAKAFANDEEMLVLLPPKLLGFVLKSKIWAQFAVDKMQRTYLRGSLELTKAFDEELQLNEDDKDLLLALVNGHQALLPQFEGSGPGIPGHNNQGTDVIEGEGQGLAIMLHGPPGVGKTLTAETIAKRTNRPLLSVSVAEIGVQPHEAEHKLTDIFADAARWQAVLLMDEADVFVEERQKGELDRNALVSELLRCLEYYEGIIILTTNRIRTIDIALQSRIHLAIQYKGLSADSSLQIYKDNLARIPPNEIEHG
ncbi:hypothetical protein CLAFUW4_03719 [Fulvia fulva]|uniref:AAA+ ATPase domain-containing protein n=1 Tax=Passalora fulva TaxID=5499 RepID=A0A9Q8P5C5_PASFU|nr:uncharacterized protein CLAFUR5_03694 [Fulvia fulva]KAK4631369.1 hypothetical protein CLAFUR4_03707 [Fulvia fulva]UJO13858.1 hypothetical protein CLAFUR5_03694 [Fulvia fulva]WPV11679.1 hypothetical protein CLAFUW4_03719 [Fulvia fulva]WPV26127.1 hypothetical protein CLAFUW7_03711 [Fulvia fulva]